MNNKIKMKRKKSEKKIEEPLNRDKIKKDFFK